MSKKSYRLPQKTYQITSIIASYGKQRIAQKHPQNALPTLQQADTSDVGKQPGSSQVHGLPTPSKILPMHSIHLQTPEGKDPKHSADISSTPTEGNTDLAKSAKRRLYTLETSSDKVDLLEELADPQVMENSSDPNKTDNIIGSPSKKIVGQQDPASHEKATYSKRTRSTKN